jgi:hypothetical protein
MLACALRCEGRRRASAEGGNRGDVPMRISRVADLWGFEPGQKAVLSGRRWHWLMQKVASGSDVVLAVGVGEQAVVADPMKALGQQMQQEAAHELIGLQGHGFVACVSVFAIVLPAEGDASIIQCHEARVGDGHPMGVANSTAQSL